MSNNEDSMTWHCTTVLKKFEGDSTDDKDLIEKPTVIEGNLVMYGGVSSIWEALTGNAPTYFSNANAAIGVGDSTTAAAATQTDMQAATNKIRVAMDATYPQHTDGTGSATNAQIVYRSTFGTSTGNFAWNEWGVFNTATAGSGRMLNRKQEALGTKVTNSTWQLTVTLSIA